MSRYVYFVKKEEKQQSVLLNMAFWEGLEWIWLLTVKSCLSLTLEMATLSVQLIFCKLIN